MRAYKFRLFADYFQFCLQDEQAEGFLGESWTQEASDRLLALAPGTIGIGTARNMHVPVTLEIRDTAPDDDPNSWDQILECSIDVPSGRLVIAGCTDYFPETARISLVPGTYRARVYYADLNSLSADGLEGNDEYRVVLWPAPAGDLEILKPRKRITDG
jgi:hypothetical protein